MTKEHGIIEDIAAEIGYTAAVALVSWFGNANLFVPTEATEDHPIGKIIGMPAFKRLVKMFDGHAKRERNVWLAIDHQQEIDRRDRLIAVLYECGFGSKTIASITNLSERTVQHIRKRIEDLGVLPLILKRAGIPDEKLVGKATQENAGKKSAQKPRMKTGVKSQSVTRRPKRKTKVRAW